MLIPFLNQLYSLLQLTGAAVKISSCGAIERWPASVFKMWIEYFSSSQSLSAFISDLTIVPTGSFLPENSCAAKFSSEGDGN